MAYAAYTVSSTQAVVDAMFDFAKQAAGWEDSYMDGNAAVLVPPNKTRRFRLTSHYFGGGFNEDEHYYIRTRLTDAGGVNQDTSISEIIDSYTQFFGDSSSYANSVYGMLPTRVEFFGRAEPYPFIVAAIECTPGFYRHLYVGYLEDNGWVSDADNGEVISGSPCAKNTSTRSWYRYSDHEPAPSLFEIIRGGSNHTDQGGGVNVNGLFYQFSTRNSPTTRKHLLGGSRSAGNFISSLRGKNVFSGYTPFTPVHLLAGTTSTSDNFWMPLGYVAGVRHCNLTNFFPGQLVTLPDGSEWRTYPLLRRSEDANGSSGPSLNAGEPRSGTRGYAFLMDD